METTSETIKAAKCGDAEIEYSVRGEGEPLLLVHAGVFADWFAPLAASRTLDGFRIIRVRRAGYGPNAPATHLTIQNHASHLMALIDILKLKKVHAVGHSSGALIALQLAADRPQLVQSLTLIEPAPCGPFQVPAFAEIGERFVGPAMGAFAAGNLSGAFDTFMRGVCGDRHRDVIEQTLGPAGYEQAVRESGFFFRDEVPASFEGQVGPAEFGSVRQPVLVVEGGEGRKLGPFSQQVTALVAALLPQAELALIDAANHMVPLQDPEALGKAVASFARRHPLGRTGAGHAAA